MKMPTWKIVADENILFAEALFGVFGDVVLMKGRDISAQDVKDADVLLVRSVTQVDQRLLEGSRVKFVGTCTIGIDHLQTAWLEAQGIKWSAAPGCNAMAVVQYVLSCLAVNSLLERRSKIAIVGCGNVGARLYRTLKALGNECICVDPFKSRDEIPDLARFEDIFGCDVVCLHTPLTTTGSHPTRHMINESNLGRFNTGTLLLNAGRGAVIDNVALLEFLERGNKLNAVLDVWEPEPNINRRLLDLVVLGTPHIAGYSYEGKVNGTLMIFDALCEYAECEADEKTVLLKQNVTANAFGQAEVLKETSLSQAILATYDVREDDRRLRAQASGLPATFDALRKHYPLHREPTHYCLDAEIFDSDSAAKLGFILNEQV